MERGDPDAEMSWRGAAVTCGATEEEFGWGVHADKAMITLRLQIWISTVNGLEQ